MTIVSYEGFSRMWRWQKLPLPMTWHFAAAISRPCGSVMKAGLLLLPARCISNSLAPLLKSISSQIGSAGSRL